MRLLTKIFCCNCLLLMSLQGYTQIIQKLNDSLVTLSGKPITTVDSLTNLPIRTIVIKGLRKTKPYIVLREFRFIKGDSLMAGTLEKQLEQARVQIYNTTLFDKVRIDAALLDNNELALTIQVKERWYIYPVPQFQLVDRNFNEWWNTYNRSFDRVNYGLKFVHYNLSGRRDQLRIYLINGYSRNISLTYSNPYSNRKLTEGFAVGVGYSQNREISYKTDSFNKLQFYPVKPAGAKIQTGEFVRNSWYASAGYIIRRGLFRRHSISATYNFLKVDDSVLNVKYNPHYFNRNDHSTGFLDLSYVFQYTDLNNVAYPLKGLSGFFAASKRGFGWSGGINMLMVEGGLNRYWSLGKNWYGSAQLTGRLKLPFEQPYINQRGLGYGENYLRGLEYYVIDGVATGLLRTTLKKKIIAFSVPFPILHRITNRIPFTIFAKTFGDLGYAYNKKQYYSYLNNRLLYSGGFGIDVLTLYDINLRFEYSFNQLRESGLFFHTQNGF